ncbi:MAG: AAA family ATPase [Clostridia bacterium]|nr:AAA family ATPase [Clostridia bacterium]
MNRLFALVGMCGSGKSVLCEHFKNRGWDFVYFGGVTMNELKKRGLEKNEENERKIREELRATYGQAAFAILLIDEIEEKLEKGDVVIDGLYSWSEFKVLDEKFGDRLKLIAVIADKSVRYHRLTKREVRPLTPEQAKSRDRAEIENLEKGGPIAVADWFVDNNGSIEDTLAQTDAIIDGASRPTRVERGRDK